jgi:hypothetical protein
MVHSNTAQGSTRVNNICSSCLQRTPTCHPSSHSHMWPCLLAAPAQLEVM